MRVARFLGAVNCARHSRCRFQNVSSLHHAARWTSSYAEKLQHDLAILVRLWGWNALQITSYVCFACGLLVAIGRGKGCLHDSFSAHPYSCSCRCCCPRSSQFGAPQRRTRLYFVMLNRDRLPHVDNLLWTEPWGSWCTVVSGSAVSRLLCVVQEDHLGMFVKLLSRRMGEEVRHPSGHYTVRDAVDYVSRATHNWVEPSLQRFQVRV